LIEEYLEAQHLFLRRLLGINSRSMLAVLFTETGLMPIRVRRLLLGLSRLRYLADLGPERRVRIALLDSLDLLEAGHSCWAGDIAILLRSLPTPIQVTAKDFLAVESVEAIAKRVIEAVDADLQFDIDHLKKTHLLRNRLELLDDKLTMVTRRRRHYLTMVPIPAHRKALTRLLLSDHNLSSERLRYPARYRLAIPEAERLCRFCRREVENEVHALLVCDGHQPLAALREAFLVELFECDVTLEATYMILSCHDFLGHMVSSRKAVKRVAKFVCEVLNLYDSFERYIPTGFER
ncbi:hypothetical protein C8F04DRAFT_968411, partial [Mycena alexandri]